MCRNSILLMTGSRVPLWEAAMPSSTPTVVASCSWLRYRYRSVADKQLKCPAGHHSGPCELAENGASTGAPCKLAENRASTGTACLQHLTGSYSGLYEPDPAVTGQDRCEMSE